MDYISREAAFDAAQQSISDKRTHDFNAGCARAANNILALPAADVRPVVRGEWRKSELFNDHPECPVCSYVSTERSNFCPNCGAMMGGQDNA